MRREVYTEIKRILEDTFGPRTVKLWQVAQSDTDALGKYPQLYVQFTATPYTTGTKKIQECKQGRFTLHMIWDSINPDDLQILDHSQTAYKALAAAGYERTDEQVQAYGPEGEVTDWQIFFNIPPFLDADAQPGTIRIPAPTLEAIDETAHPGASFDTILDAPIS